MRVGGSCDVRGLAPTTERASECSTLNSTRSRSAAQTVRDVLARYCPRDVRPPDGGRPLGYPTALWAQLGELDLIGLMLPESYGGSGM